MKKKIGLTVTCFSLAFLFAGCTAASRSSYVSLGNPHKVEMYSGGVKVREWISNGIVHNETNSDGYYFQDKETGKLIRVSGDIVITTL